METQSRLYILSSYYSDKDWEKLHLLARWNKVTPDEYAAKLIQEALDKKKRPRLPKHDWTIYSLSDSKGIFYIGTTQSEPKYISQLGNDSAKERMEILHAVGEKPTYTILMNNLSKEDAERQLKGFIEAAITNGQKLTNK